MLIIERIRIGAQVDQQPGDHEPIFRHGEQERRTASRVAGFQVRTRANSERRGCRVTTLCRSE